MARCAASQRRGEWGSAGGGGRLDAHEREHGLYRLLALAPDIDAVFACNDQMALGALHLAIGLLAIGGLGSATLAQSASPMPTATSPAVGAWLLTIVDNPTAPIQEAIFHADGTYIQYDGAGGVGMGTWEPTGPNTGDVTIVQYGVDQNGKVGHSTIRATFEVGADGKSLTAAYTLEYVDGAGTSTGQMGPSSATATRVAVEPMGSPVAPLSGRWRLRSSPADP